jgi:hypothetical protein
MLQTGNILLLWTKNGATLHVIERKNRLVVKRDGTKFLFYYQTAITFLLSRVNFFILLTLRSHLWRYGRVRYI